MVYPQFWLLGHGLLVLALPLVNKETQSAVKKQAGNRELFSF